jgi:hypothetical protein
MSCKIGDLVRIVSSVPDSSFYIAPNVVGFIRSIDDGVAYICLIDREGHMSGGQPIPLACLAPETRPEWVSAMETRRANVAASLERMRETQQRRNALAEQVASRYGITREDAFAIHEELSRLV